MLPASAREMMIHGSNVHDCSRTVVIGSRGDSSGVTTGMMELCIGLAVSLFHHSSIPIFQFSKIFSICP